MTSKLKLLVATTTVSVAMLGVNPAFAAGTTSGTDITNNVSVAFNVGGIAQTAEIDSDTFTVDRAINLTVAQVGTATTSVSPGQNDAVTTFTVTNHANDVLDFALSSAQGTAVNGGVDNFDVTGLQVFVESGTTTGYQPSEDTATFIDALAADGTQTVYILGDVAGTLVTDDVSGVVLTATAHESTSAALDALVTETAGANTAGVDTVFADLDGPGAEGAQDGAHSAGDDYTVSAANISVFKSSRVVSDPINGATNPKAIPGAIIEYCISVANAPSSATATGIAVSDTLPVDVETNGITFNPGSILLNGTVTSPGASQTCTGGVGGGGFVDPVVSGTLADIAGGASSALIFQVTVD